MAFLNKVFSNKTIFILTVLFVFSFKLNAQDLGKDKFGSWFAISGINLITNKISLDTGVQFRYYEFAHNYNLSLIRTAINYNLSPKTMVSFGYLYMDTSSYAKEEDQVTTSENRIYEQFILRNSIGKLNFIHRYRLEQRWINTLGTTEIFNRFRYNLQLNYPITERLYLVVFDEIMMNFEPNLFNQNRLFGGIRYNVNKDLFLQAGYLRNTFSNIAFNRIFMSAIFRTNFIRKALKNKS